MQNVSLIQIVKYLDELLQIDNIHDFPEAYNGLQIENKSKTVSLIGGSVDCNPTTIRMAIEVKVDLLIVHHGIFWRKRIPWTGSTFEILKMTIENNLAIYSVHLPLDLHPIFGNNSQLCKALGLNIAGPALYDQSKNCYFGLYSNTPIPRQSLVNRITKSFGIVPKIIPAGAEKCEKIVVASGSSGALVEKVAREGYDTFITGEGPHWTFSEADEFKLNVIYVGHYISETLGIRALCEHLSEKFKLAWTFIDHPSGL